MYIITVSMCAPECPMRTFEIHMPSILVEEEKSKQYSIRIRSVPKVLEGLGPLYLLYVDLVGFYEKKVICLPTKAGLHPLFLNDMVWDRFCTQGDPMRKEIHGQHLSMDIQFYSPAKHDVVHQVLIQTTMNPWGDYYDSNELKVNFCLAQAHAAKKMIQVLATFQLFRRYSLTHLDLLWVDPSDRPQYLVFKYNYLNTDARFLTVFSARQHRKPREWQSDPSTWKNHIYDVCHQYPNRVYVLAQDKETGYFCIAYTDIQGESSCTPWTTVFFTKHLTYPEWKHLRVSPNHDIMVYTEQYRVGCLNPFMIRVDESGKVDMQTIPYFFAHDGVKFDAIGNLLVVENLPLFHGETIKITFHVASHTSFFLSLPPSNKKSLN